MATNENNFNIQGTKVSLYVFNGRTYFKQDFSEDQPQIKILPYNLPPPVTFFRGRTQMLADLKTLITTNKIVVVSGLGGMGKSELVKKYAAVNREVYRDNIIWINSVSNEEIILSFIILARYLLNYRNDRAEEVNVIVQNIYNQFTERTLFVFDNVADQESIEQFLNIFNANVHVIITSQFTTWNNRSVLKIEKLTEGESIEIFKAIYKRYNNRDEETWKTLAKQLGYFPLVLIIAATYIEEEDNDFNYNFSLNNYMEILEESGIFNLNIDLDKLDTILELTLNKIDIQLRKSKLYAKKNINALDILNICAYLDPYYITKKILLKFLKGIDENILILILSCISKYSLITTDRVYIYIDILIQEFLINQHKKNNVHEKYFMQILSHVVEDDMMFLHRRHVIKYAEKHSVIAAKCYNKTESIKFLQIFAQYGCHKTLKEIFLSMLACRAKIIIDKYALLAEVVNSGSLETTKLILEFTKDINRKNSLGYSPLQVAVEGKYIEIQQFLIENGASDQQNKDGLTQLHESLKTGNILMAQFLIENTTDLSIPDKNGNISLHYIAMYRKDLFEDSLEYIDISERLISKTEMNINDLNKSKFTALHFAAKFDDLIIGKLFMQCPNIDVNVENMIGNTPLHLAVFYNKLDFVNLLLENECKPDVPNFEKDTPLHFAAKFGYLNIAQSLIPRLNNVDVQNKKGNTSLHLALIYETTDIARILAQITTNIKIKNNNGDTVLALAEKRNVTDVVQILRNRNL